MENKTKIDNITATLMIAAALFYDGVQTLLTAVGIGPFVNWLISIFAWLTFWLWFTIKGVSFTNNPKRLFTFMGGSLLEIIPLIATLPIWTANITATVFITKAENKIKKAIS
ncbi:MAG: hypothetical protein KAV41_01695 [Candidatus Pacebacteria bacterium]|nr:hypothetical protein [Candidatus Paceibacterota bacterium]